MLEEITKHNWQKERQWFTLCYDVTNVVFLIKRIGDGGENHHLNLAQTSK